MAPGYTLYAKVWLELKIMRGEVKSVNRESADK